MTLITETIGVRIADLAKQLVDAGWKPPTNAEAGKIIDVRVSLDAPPMDVLDEEDLRWLDDRSDIEAALTFAKTVSPAIERLHELAHADQPKLLSSCRSEPCRSLSFGTAVLIEKGGEL